MSLFCYITNDWSRGKQLILFSENSSRETLTDWRETKFTVSLETCKLSRNALARRVGLYVALPAHCTCWPMREWFRRVNPLVCAARTSSPVKCWELFIFAVLQDNSCHLLFLESLSILAPALLLFSVLIGWSPLAVDLARRLGTEWVLMAGKRTRPSKKWTTRDSPRPNKLWPHPTRKKAACNVCSWPLSHWMKS